MLLYLVKRLSRNSPRHYLDVALWPHFLRGARIVQTFRIQPPFFSDGRAGGRLLCYATPSRELATLYLHRCNLALNHQLQFKIPVHTKVFQTNQCQAYHSLASRNPPSDTSTTHSCGCLINRSLHSSHLDKNFTLVYELSKAKYRQLQFISFFSYFLAAYWIYLAPDVLVGAFEHDSLNSQSSLDLMGLLVSTFIIPSLIQYVRKQLVLKAYYNKVTDTYKLVTQKATLCQRTEDISRQEIKRVIWSKKTKTDRPVQARFQAKNKVYIMYAPYFKLPADYNYMMGFSPKKK